MKVVCLYFNLSCTILNFIFKLFLFTFDVRSDLEDEDREINHHGHAVKVGGDDAFSAPSDRY